jgi:cytochrome c oxidase cbb3-type subunit 4
MKADMTQHILTNFIAHWWTPVFFGIFLLIILYALWPRNRAAFDEASRMPLRED